MSYSFFQPFLVFIEQTFDAPENRYRLIKSTNPRIIDVSEIPWK